MVLVSVISRKRKSMISQGRAVGCSSYIVGVREKWIVW